MEGGEMKASKIEFKQGAIIRYSNGVIKTVTNNGALLTYPCGTKRWIANSWYVDIETMGIL